MQNKAPKNSHQALPWPGTKHELKVWKQFYPELQAGTKTFEVRINDRNYQVGDMLILQEYDPLHQVYTGQVLYRRVTYILHGGKLAGMTFGIDAGYVIMAIAPIRGIITQARKGPKKKPCDHTWEYNEARHGNRCTKCGVHDFETDAFA